MNTMRRRWLASLPSARTRRALLGDATQRERAGLLLAGLLLLAGIWSALTFSLPGTSGLQVGQPSPLSISAPTEAIYTSDLLTAERRAQAENSLDNLVYINDPQIPIVQRRELFTLLETIGRLRDDPALADSARAQALADLPSGALQISADQAAAILALDDEGWSQLRTATLSLYDRAIERYDYAVDERGLAQLRERWLSYWLATTTLGPDQRGLAFDLTQAFLRVNRTLDEPATAERRAQAAALVPPVQISVLPGEIIIREGEIVTPAIAEKLQAAGAMPRPLSWPGLIGRGIIAALLSAGLIGYARTFQPAIARRARSLLVLTGCVLVGLLAARLLLNLSNLRPSIFPLATLAIVLAVVFNGQLSLAAVTVAAVTIGVMDSNDLPLATTLFASCVSAIIVVRNADRLLTFVLAGLAVTGTIFSAEIAFWLAKQSSFLPTDLGSQLLPALLSAAINGSLTIILSLGVFNVVSRMAGQVTPLQLMELAHPARPLLRKLIREAPGTYYHSIAVGNLAESAAEAIGADALLLRVAAYYHDIGKTVRPAFFTDNQMGRDNVHDELDPHTSAQIIVDHVREGVKIARAAGLPEQLVIFIATHHGTGLIRHFYQLALQQQDNVDERDFRYPGPRPQTREQALLMLADSVEATVRSKAQHGKLLPGRGGDPAGRAALGGAQALDDLVQSIIDARVREGELDDAALTIRELGQIKQAFVTSLQSIYHPRVDYAPPLVR